MSIHVILRLDPIGEDGVGVTAETLPFSPKDETEAVGCFWVGICQSINEYVRAKGLSDFDCMKQYPDGGASNVEPQR